MIGIFDSGVGGLTVVRSIKKAMPNMPIVYFGDTARVPWGTKSKWAVTKYSQEITEFLISQGVEAVVIACNTASAIATKSLKEQNNSTEIFDVIDPCIKRVVKFISKNKEGNILVIGTSATILSGSYEKKIHRELPKVKIYSQACPLFVPLVEEGWLEGVVTKKIVKKYLGKYLNRNIKHIILGCTHYPLLVNAIGKLFGKDVDIISSADEIANVIKSHHQLGDLKKTSPDKYYFSDWSKHNEKLTEIILGKKPKIRIHRFESK